MIEWLLCLLFTCSSPCAVEVVRYGEQVGCYDHPNQAFEIMEPGDIVIIQKGSYRIGIEEPKKGLDNVAKN